MSDELMHFFTRNMARLRKETFVDKFGKTLKVLDSTERWAVLVQYLNHANTETHLAFPGVKTLAQLTGLDPKNVRAARADIVRAGWFTPAGSVNYGQQSQKLPGTGKKGRKSGVAAYLITLPGMADELPLQGGAVRGVTGGVTGGVTTTPQTKTETIKPPKASANSSGQRDQAKGGSKKAETPAAVMAARLVERDLADKPPKQPAGLPLKRQKQKDLLPLCEQALAFPGAAAHPTAADRVALAWYRSEKPDRHDMAALEGLEVPYFSHEKLPAPVPMSLDQLPPEVQDMVRPFREQKTAKAG